MLWPFIISIFGIQGVVHSTMYVLATHLSLCPSFDFGGASGSVETFYSYREQGRVAVKAGWTAFIKF